ncbi:unnamed protein product [Amoebophrya sp. A25]|nr:unnamed protein product [Amoebophrya sp. A25]|eukprot:GSA25T00027586001.1
MTAPAHAPGPRRLLLGLSCICLTRRCASDSAPWPSVGLWVTVYPSPYNNNTTCPISNQCRGLLVIDIFIDYRSCRRLFSSM